ncbi:MAG: hypothetical protein P4L46_17760 [Fimbriimonas sp.]|nr:hypothetical protein [Fimbriimonas sp.]
MSTIFLVMILIFVALVALIVFAATSNRQSIYRQGPIYGDPDVVIVDDTPLIAGMVAADIATDIAFGAAESAMMADQGGFMDSSDSGFGGGDFMGGDSAFDSSSGGFDMGGGDF